MDYYKVLGLKQGASLEEIRKAYKKYATKFHPDKHNDDEFFKERFQEIQEAYEYLTQNYEESEIVVEEKATSQTSYNKGRNSYSKIDAFVYDIESSTNYRTWKKQEEESRKKRSNRDRFLETLTWISGILIFIVALWSISLEQEIGWQEILISLVVAFAAPAMFFGLIIHVLLDYVFEYKHYTMLLAFCKHDGQYVEIYYPYKYESKSKTRQTVYSINAFKQMATWNVRVNNADIPLTSFMSGGGTVKISYFINKMKIGIDTFNLPN
ncbi:MAG: DnaJ domain-containing protein [Dysgonamonadaceae bacterium]|jgi:hypothetical protein|nr:DnaJ domain-containing protein [Dysgonamonadaceae bacterium]